MESKNFDIILLTLALLTKKSTPLSGVISRTDSEALSVKNEPGSTLQMRIRSITLLKESAAKK